MPSQARLQIVLDLTDRNQLPRPQHLVIFGPGSLLHWYEAKSLFEKLAISVYENHSRADKDRPFPFIFLGYPSQPYGIADTVYTTLSDISQALDNLLTSYPENVVESFDLVLHSLFGTATIWWLKNRASAAQLKRIRSVTTINSPLKGSDVYWNAYLNEFFQKNREFLGRNGPPPIFLELSDHNDASIASINQVSIENPPIGYLYTIGTLNDEIVDEANATVDWAKDHYVVPNVRRGSGALIRHNQVLAEDLTAAKILKILNELPETIAD